MKVIAKFTLALALALLLAWAVRTFAFTIFTVPQGGLPPQLKEGNRVIVNRVDCDYFGRGDIVVFSDSVVILRKNQGRVQGKKQHRIQSNNQGRKIVLESFFIGKVEKMPGDTIRIDTANYIIPTICCKRCGCKDCRFYLVKTASGRQLVHKHQMIGKAYKLF